MLAETDKPIILVVEDQALIRMSALDFLEDAGFAVLEADNALQAGKIFEGRPDIAVVFTDIGMTGRFDGLAFARQVSARRPEVQLLVTSGRPRASVRGMPFNCRFFPKPYSPTSVTSALFRFISARPAMSTRI